MTTSLPLRGEATKRKGLRGGVHSEMAQWVEVPAAKPDGLNLIPECVGEIQLLQVVLWLLLVCCGRCVHRLNSNVIFLIAIVYVVVICVVMWNKRRRAGRL